ncbi:MAG: MoaD/ThiS family protein [SAR324 cluster bacterium]|nr:MoaD/ThiS family protein [SAR324 cluster bacterium]
MMEIRVKFLSYIKFETGLDEVQVSMANNSAIADLVESLRAAYGEQLARFMFHQETGKFTCLFMRDNQIVDPSEKLQHGDSLIVMPLFAGG